MNRGRAALAGVAILALVAACGEDDFDLADQAATSLTRVHVERTYFKDELGRYVYLAGANVSGSDKFPASYDPVSYVGKPFPLEDADLRFAELADMGLNAIRLVLSWEGIEPTGKGQYDTAYLDFIEGIVAAAGRHGIYVLLDMHQDLFSRHILAFYDDQTGQNWLFDEDERTRAAPYGFNNRVAGDGAPAWVVQTCLPEKNVGGPYWGLPPEVVPDPKETTSFLPYSLWGINIFTSLDVDRCFAAFFAGDVVFPGWAVEGLSVKDYLQDAYANAWREVAVRVAGYPNVLGYDLMNEPDSTFLMLTVWALLFQIVKEAPGGALSEDEVLGTLDRVLAAHIDAGMAEGQAERIREVFLDENLLPRTLAEFRRHGFPPEDGKSFEMDWSVAASLNFNFNRNYLQPFFSRVGQAIQEVDPRAVLFIEASLGLSDRSGIGGQWITPMTRPEGLNQIVFAPHFYTDIYPFLGVNQPPREFTVDEKRFREYRDGILDATALGAFSLGNPPVVLGEFGSYFNFGGIERAMAENYAVTSAILDPYFEVLEELLLHRTIWCYSPENTALDGEGWNKEDFSIMGPDRRFRSATAWARPAPRFLSGRPIAMHFYSDHHYYDPVPDRPVPRREFFLEMGARETPAPTEISVPEVQYPDGFYVYISDGRCAYDPDRHILYWYPSDDDPGASHTIRLRPPYEDFGDEAWDYFFRGGTVRENGRHG